jgi:hypothetical protein
LDARRAPAGRSLRHSTRGWWARTRRKNEPPNEEEAKKIVEALNDADWTVAPVDKRERRRNAGAAVHDQ